jgi:hypothetical protein
VKQLKKNIKKYKPIYLFYLRIIGIWIRLKIFLFGEKRLCSKEYSTFHEVSPNLKDPKGLNEKIVWLKLNYYKKYFQTCSDKFLVRQFIKKRHPEYADKLVPLIKVYKRTKDFRWDDLTYPCIIKASNGSGQNLIINNKNEYSDSEIRYELKRMKILANNLAVSSCEHQYLTRNAFLVVEKLLEDANGNIPNDYKFFYFNGSLEFIYCSVDRRGINVRQIYDKDWNRLEFMWVQHAEEFYDEYSKSDNIPVPKHYSEMLKVSNEIAKDFPFVRVDFYDTEESYYIGEITLHHGGGNDSFYPEKYDLYYGDKLRLPDQNRKPWGGLIK